MDDDPQLCEITKAMIESLDYKVDIAKHGEEALSFYRKYHAVNRPYDAVLLDLTIVGGMGGEETFKRLREIDPDVRAIVSSGYDNDDMARQFIEAGFCGYLTKPYRV
ncbi:MAG: response regulator, partial [Opitutaceae bacterium]|nr:response regulator [Opitutaceae bacterium]